MGEAKNELAKLVPLVNANSRATKIMESWPRTMLLELEGETGPFYLIIDQGRMSLEEKSPKEPDIIMQGSAAEFARVARGDKDITHPLGHGHLRLSRGKGLELVIFLSRIFGAVHRKKLEAA